MASDGASVNYLIGSTAHPIIHAILGAACVGALRCHEIHHNKTEKNPITYLDSNKVKNWNLPKLTLDSLVDQDIGDGKTTSSPCLGIYTLSPDDNDTIERLYREVFEETK